MEFAASLEGFRVLDISTQIAGPYAAMVLGDLGAEVIKIERTPGGDDTRALPPRWDGASTVFISMNRNKRSVLVDFKSEQGRAAILRLAQTADVIVDNFPPGAAEKLRLTARDMHAANPRLIVCSISAFGDGPIGAALPGYDALAQAASGMMSITGHPGQEPVRIGPSVLDTTSGLWAVIGVMAALRRREETGRGDHIRASLFDSALSLMHHQIQGFLATGVLPKPLGSSAPSAAPYRVYNARDGQLMLATSSDPAFVRLCEAIGLADLPKDPKFANMPARIAAREELDAIVGEALAQRDVEHWLQVLSAVGVGVSRVNDLEQALHGPLGLERGMLVEPERLDWAEGLPLLRLPIDQSGEGVRLPPPALGEHTEEVLAAAGFSADEIAALRSR